MQDLIFYVAPYGARGIVRDNRNAHNAVPPPLTRGVPARLRLRLFADRSSDLPYPAESLAHIVSWRFIMDDDWDRGTVCKLAADSAAITVRTVSDVVDGAAKQHTEFSIPLYDTDTDMLRAWLGRDPIKAGLQGELTGFDSVGDPVFVLQIENFSVRNRVASPALCGGEAATGHGVTREQVADMISSAVEELNVTSGGCECSGHLTEEQVAGMISSAVAELPASAEGIGFTTRVYTDEIPSMIDLSDNPPGEGLSYISQPSNSPPYIVYAIQDDDAWSWPGNAFASENQASHPLTSSDPRIWITTRPPSVWIFNGSRLKKLDDLTVPGSGSGSGSGGGSGYTFEDFGSASYPDPSTW